MLFAAIASAVMILSWHSAVYSQGLKVNWTIQKVSGEWLTNCLLDSLSGTVLSFHQDSVTKSVPLDTVAVLWSPDRSHPFVGLLIGAAVGGVVGSLVAPEPYTEHQTSEFIFHHEWDETVHPAPAFIALTASLSGFIGYLIGSQGAERTYDLRDMKLRQKVGIVSSLFRRGNQ
jgi:hypothetical protein